MSEKNKLLRGFQQILSNFLFICSIIVEDFDVSSENYSTFEEFVNVAA